MSNAKPLSIKATKVVFKGEKFWKINEFSCYNIDDLPFKYFDTMPICYQEKNKMVVVFNDSSSIEIKKDGLVSASEFGRVIRTVRYCGHKLHLIDLDIKEARKTWVGTEEFDISKDSYVPKVREHKNKSQKE